jgi:glycosyltransferase involved in cell wall biosynthesis
MRPSPEPVPDAAGPAPVRVLVALGNAALFGQERENIEVLRAVREAGVDALFVTNERWGHHQIEPYLDRLGLAWTRLRYALHFTHRLPKTQLIPNVVRLGTGSRRFLQVLRSYRPTHVQVANPHYFLCVLPALLLTRTPVVFRLGDVPTVHHALYRQLWRRAILPRTARFVCVSEFIRDQIMALGAPRDQTDVVYALPPSRPPRDGGSDLPTDLRDEASGRAPRFAGRTVVFVGEVGEHKGVHLLVEAVGALLREGHAVRLLVAGQSKAGAGSPFAARIQALVEALPEGADVRFLGYLEDVEGLMGLADVHAAPSVCEDAAPLVVLEAKRAGVPSVVFPAGGLPEFVHAPGVDGVVCADRSVPALVDGLRHFVTLEAGALDASKQAARASLDALGITPIAFVQAWRRIYDETRPGAPRTAATE